MARSGFCTEGSGQPPRFGRELLPYFFSNAENAGVSRNKQNRENSRQQSKVLNQIWHNSKKYACGCRYPHRFFSIYMAHGMALGICVRHTGHYITKTGRLQNGPGDFSSF
jgi:hypothetical protein